MSEQYTPTTDDVRDALSEWMWNSRTWRPGLIGADMNGAFDRWLDQVRREAKIEGLREARDQVRAPSFWADGSDNYADRVRGWLSHRADQLEQEGKNDDLPYP